MKNTEREKLIEVLRRMPPYTNYSCEKHIEDTADYLLANGVIIPPVKIGQTVYTIQGQKKYPKEWKVVGIWKSEECCNFHAVCYVDGKFEASSSFEDWMIGKTVYLTKGEAEQALKGGAE